MFYVLRPERSKGLGCDYRSSVTAKRFIPHDDGLHCAWRPVVIECEFQDKSIYLLSLECLGGGGFNAPISHD